MSELELRKRVVSVMQNWIGYSESNGKFKTIIDLYNSKKPLPRGYAVKYTDEWCATTVSAAFIKAGLSDISFAECSCTKMIELYKTAGRWQERDSYVPTIGDILMYDWDDSGMGDNTGLADHVGIVTGISGNVLTIIEGNRNRAVSARNIQVNGRYIRGYCLPNYGSKVNDTEYAQTDFVKDVQRSFGAVVDGIVGNETISKTLTVSAKYNNKHPVVKAIQKKLYSIGYSEVGEADGVAGQMFTNAVMRFQKDNGCVVDGKISAKQKTWKKLLGML